MSPAGDFEVVMRRDQGSGLRQVHRTQHSTPGRALQARPLVTRGRGRGQPAPIAGPSLGGRLKECAEKNSLIERLRELIHDYETLRAHHSEFIPDGYPVSGVVQRALDAAVCGGIAVGLGQALEEIEAYLEGTAT